MPTKSPHADIEIPEVDLWSFLFERKTRDYPDDKVLFTDSETDRHYTFSQLKNAAVDFGKGLRAIWDWQKGDTVVMYTPNSIDTPAVMFGTLWAGGILSPANPAYTPAELAFQLKDSGAKALVTQKALLKNAVAAAKIAGIPENRILLLGDAKDESMKFKHFTNLKNTSGATRWGRVKSKPNDVCYLVYSSGTTGHPKGVMLSNYNIIANVSQGAATEGVNFTWQNDRILAFLPFFHIYGLTCHINSCVYQGVELVVMAAFDFEKFCAIIQNKKITFSYVVPPVVLALSKHPSATKYDLSSLRMLNSGAAPLTKELVDGAYNRLKIKVKQGYGMSECSPTTHSMRWEDWNSKAGSVGLLSPNMVAKYMNAEEKEVAAGEVGELWVKGPNVFLGYLNNAKGTQDSMTEDGYYKTGDVGYQDAEGNFYITDRIKELIKYKGFQVPPAELEGLLASHPDVADVAVIGIQDEEQATEVPRAYIVLSPGVEASPATAKKLAEWMGAKVAHHKKLRGGVRFIDVVPKSSAGKILRRVLKDQVKAEKAGKSKL